MTVRSVLRAALAGILTLLVAHGVRASSGHTTYSASTVAHRVAAIYEERHPRVTHLERTLTDSTPHQPMYFMTLKGQFHRGHKQARSLSFSALTRRWYVWGIVAFDAHQHIVWTDRVLPRHPQ